METATNKLIAGLGEVEYGVLKETYCRLQELRTSYGAMYEGVRAGSMPDFTEIEAVHLMLEDIVGELERFFLSLCTEEESCGPAMCELDR